MQVTPTDTPINHGIFLESVALAPLYAVTMPFIVTVSIFLRMQLYLKSRNI